MNVNSSGVPFLSGKRSSSPDYRDNYDKIFRDRPVENILYIVVKNCAVFFATKDSELVDVLTTSLIKSYEERILRGASHTIFIKQDGKYLLDHRSYISGEGEVISDRFSPRLDKTEEFILLYGEIND